MSDIKSYLPEFDDFILFKQQHNRIKKIKKPSSSLEHKMAEKHFIQFIYQNYLHLGIDFLREQVDLKIDSDKYKNVINDYINKAIKYKSTYISDLKMMLEYIGESSYLDTFSQYYPINRHSLKALICDLKDTVEIKDISKLYTLSVWYSYGKGIKCLDYPYDSKKNNEYNQDIYIRKNLRVAIEYLPEKDQYLFVSIFLKTFIKLVVINKSQFIKTYPLSNSYILSIKPVSPYLSDGGFDLPWSYVTFMNGYMFLYHPSFPDGGSNHQPLRHIDEKSRKALNDIKGYIIKKLPPIKVTAEKNRIVAIQDINQISEAVEYLNMASTNEHVKLSEKEKSKVKSGSIHNQDSNEVLEKLKLYKSKYLEYLSDINLVNHKVYYALESRVNSSEIYTTEVAFIFTLKQDQEHTLIIYENNLPARVSVCFIVKTERYNEAIDVINNFFSSDSINKRDMLMNNNVEFDETCIVQYFRVNHDDFNLWKSSILVI